MTALAYLVLFFMPAQEVDTLEFFEKTIRPILAESCFACHNPITLEGGLDLTSAAGFRKGATAGPLLSPDDWERSRILQAVSYEERIKMPPDSRLEPEELDAIRSWVRMGAPYPGSETPTADVTPSPVPEPTDEETPFWAFQPMGNPVPPPVEDPWPQSPIDRFLFAKLEANGLKPAPPADKLTLLRRTTYDLTGLPPTEDEIRSFIEDDSESAYETVVERLLASPRYGEKWGRRWLDLARYADSTGNDEDHRYPYAWRYRDYVIDAFNTDLPYDRFVQEQIAGDLLPAPDGSAVNRRGIVATGFLALGPKALAQQDKTKMLYDVYDEQLDVVSKAFLGLTVTCARCHDHKFDPIPTRDYYSMVGIFARTQSFADPSTHVSKLLFRPLVRDEIYDVYRRYDNRVRHHEAEIQHVIDKELARRNERLLPTMDEYMLAARRVYEGGEPLSTVSEETGLDPSLLTKWIVYLEPREIPRPHMAAWNEARPEELAEVARGYQERDRSRVEEYNEQIDAWWETTGEVRKDWEAPPPRRPEVLEGEDRFFYDVHFHEDGPLVVSAEEEERAFSAETVRRLAELREELEAVEASGPAEPDMACAVAEGEPVVQNVFLRGDYRNPGDEAPLGFLSVLSDGDAPASAGNGSGRLELARWLTQPEHPLTARVMVNRVWQWHFGEGLVRTASNFGKAGEPPSHPELLDYLARRFIESGWSVKALHRLILSSRAYRMSSEISAAANEADPENRWLSHFNRRRLDVEEIRDGLLAIEGSLDFEMGGTLDEGFGTDLENSNERLSLDPTEVRRRMVYLPLRRANLPTLLGLFDFGDAVNSVAQRPSTNVAPQALFAMNSEFVAERARNLAESLLGERDDARRLERAYLSVLNRSPTPDEIEDGETYLARFEKRFPGPGARLDAWQSFCRILMASNEFIYLD